MKICLDTCAYSKIGHQLQGLLQLIDEADQIFVPSIVLGELYAGFSMGKFDRANREALGRFIEMPAVSITSIDESVADHYGILFRTLRLQGTPIPTNDIWIAAVALETGSRLVTYHTHFNRIPGLVILAPL